MKPRTIVIKIIAAVLFVIVLSPFGAILRLLGIDWMRTKDVQKDTFWIPKT